MNTITETTSTAQIPTQPVSEKRVALIFPRIFAFIIDCIVVLVASIAISKLLYSSFENSPFLFQCMGTLLCLFYFSVFNSNVMQGKTIGKMLCKIRVADLTGQQIGFTQSLFRSAIFIIPFCFSGYLQPLASQSLIITLLLALFQSIIFACCYLAIFNRHSQQAFHDLMSKTQILRNSQSHLAYETVWKTHYILIAIMCVLIFSANLWAYFQNQQASAINFQQISADISDIRVETRYKVIGDAQSENHVLISVVNTPEYINDESRTEELTQQFKQHYPQILSENKIDQIQVNFAYQFGLAKIARTVLYDYKDTALTAKLTFNGNGLSYGL